MILGFLLKSLALSAGILELLLHFGYPSFELFADSLQGAQFGRRLVGRRLVIGSLPLGLLQLGLEVFDLG